MRAALPVLCLGVVAASCLADAASNLPSLQAERWVNSPPLTAEALRGKVVLVDFWEYTCVNWIRTASYVKAWNRDYGGARVGRDRRACAGVRVRQARREHRPRNS